MERTTRARRLVGGVVLVMVVLVLAASSGSIRLWTNPEVESAEPAPSGRDETPTAPPEREQPDDADPAEVGPIMEVIGWVIVVGMVGAAVFAARHLHWWVPTRRLWTRWLPAWSMPDPLPDVPDTVLRVDVEAALAVLSDGSPRNAIVACWMQLEDDAAAMGFERLDAETSSEYVARVVTSASVDPGPITELAALFQEARFSEHDLGDEDRARAGEVLGRVVAALHASESVPA
jgi:hypothetical protein